MESRLHRLQRQAPEGPDRRLTYLQATRQGRPHKRPQATRHHRPPARGGPTIYEGSTGGTNASWRVGPPQKRQRKPVRAPGRPPSRGGPRSGPRPPATPGQPPAGLGQPPATRHPPPPRPPARGGPTIYERVVGPVEPPRIVGPPLAGGLGGGGPGCGWLTWPGVAGG
jgi:hypothetical protein